MSDEKKFAVVPFTPKRPEPRAQDLRDQIIRNQNALAILADKQLENWQIWAGQLDQMLTLAIALADAERWDELAEFLRTVEGQAKTMASSRTRIACNLPPGLDGGAA